MPRARRGSCWAIAALAWLFFVTASCAHDLTCVSGDATLHRMMHADFPDCEPRILTYCSPTDITAQCGGRTITYRKQSDSTWERVPRRAE